MRLCASIKNWCYVDMPRVVTVVLIGVFTFNIWWSFDLPCVYSIDFLSFCLFAFLCPLVWFCVVRLFGVRGVVDF